MFDAALKRRQPAAMRRLGRQVVYQGRSGVSDRRTIVARLRRPYYEPELGVGVESVEPSIEVIVSDVPELAQGDVFIVPTDDGPGTTSYTVTNVQPDGRGLAICELRAT